MERYNLAIAEIATMTAHGGPMIGGTRKEVATITKIKLERVKLFDDWAGLYVKDLDKPTEKEKNLLSCVTRVCNRLGADILKHNQMGARRIVALLLSRVGWKEDQDLSQEALAELAATLSIYDAAKDNLKKIDLQAEMQPSQT